MRLIALAVFFGAVGCMTSSTTPNDDRQGPGELQKKSDAAQRARLLEIAANYKKYEKVDGRMRLAPAACAAPTYRGLESPYHVSRSDDESTHGRKVYTLYAAKVDPIFHNYTATPTIDGKKLEWTDQVLVKESWIAEPVDPKAPDLPPLEAVNKNGVRYRPGEKGPLFIMYQTDPKDPNSDEGWVYGTLTPDGKTVTGVGRLENCMSCHLKAPHGRLFGLPKD
jgi:hypothetical protein